MRNPLRHAAILLWISVASGQTAAPPVLLPTPEACALAAQSPAPAGPPLAIFLDSPKPLLIRGESMRVSMTARLVSLRPVTFEILELRAAEREEVLSGFVLMPIFDRKLEAAIAALQFNQLVTLDAWLGGNTEYPNTMVVAEMTPGRAPELRADACNNRSGIAVSYRGGAEYANIYNDRTVCIHDSRGVPVAAPPLSPPEFSALFKTFAGAGFDRLPATPLPGEPVDRNSITVACARYQRVAVSGLPASAAAVLRRLEALIPPAARSQPPLQKLPPPPSGSAYPENWPIGARIPAISGRVVDAITRLPIANVDVTLRAMSASGTFFGSGRGSLRHEKVRADAAGRFAFPESLEAAASLPLTGIKAYWLSVNLKFWPGNEMDAMHDDLSWDVAVDPLLRSPRDDRTGNNLAAPPVNNKAYFPIAVQFRRPCTQMWNANCLSFDETTGIDIPLIPVFDDPAACARIQERGVREQCRELNIYRRAFLLRNPSLCAQLGPFPIADRCAGRNP
jgi:hypothetical protein